MSSSQEMCLQESTEIDSEGSSSEERESRRRHLGDVDSLPKKRRKQSTPVKFPTTVGVDDCEDSEEELPSDSSLHHHDHRHGINNSLDDETEQYLEGKPTSSPTLSKSVHGHHRHPTIKDENLNNEFRCQYCSQFFDNRVALEIHLECEHRSESPQMLNSIQSRLSPESSLQHVSLDQSLSPMNLSGISIRNFAASTSWLAGQAQLHTQPDAQLAKMAAARNNNHFQATPASFPGPLAQFLPIPGFPLPDPSQIQRAAMGQFPKIFNPDAYCELCNKEFCNKYFLKTHKANKHGIYSDPPSGQSQAGDVISSGQLVTTTSGLSSNLGLKADQTIRLENNGTQQPTIPCDLCPKRFKNEDSLRKHRYKIHLNHNNDNVDPSQIQVSLPSSSGDEDMQSPVGLEMLCKQEISIDQDDSSFVTPGSARLSPQNVQGRDFSVNGNRWQRLGVMNPEAFCEICSKEYCNKYFLRTHKLKKHGIALPENDKSQNHQSSSPWHQVQTSPLDLIVNDRFGNGSESGDRIEDHRCKSCDIRFQTQGLYQLHVEKIHENIEQTSPKQDQEVDSTDQRTEAISEDLQKLQTMILQLNGLDSNKAASCAICGKDYDSPSALKNHMISEHSIVPGNLSPSQQQQQQQQQMSTSEKQLHSPTNTTAYCSVCEKDYPDQEALRKHMLEDHQPSTPTSSTQLSSSVPTTPKSTSSQLSERKTTANITPTSSYCEICNKELCNKYFMKIHMQKMHGIEIENGAQISGVICNICKKELCSKYFLRVHKQNTHGIVEEGTTPAKQENFESPVVGEDSALKPENLGDLNIRYVTHFTEVCPFCHRRFRSVRWLMSHLPEHKKAGLEKLREMEQYQQSLQKSRGSNSKSIQQQQQHQQNHANTTLRIPNGFEPNQHVRAELATHQVLSNFFGNPVNDQQGQLFHCSHENCSFSTPIRPYLFLHERSHHQETSPLESERMMQCPICAQTFNQPELLLQHVATRHSNPLPGLLSQFPFPLLNEFALANEHQLHQLERNEYSESKEDLRRSSPQIVNDLDPSKKENKSVQVVPPGSFKCSQCGFVSANLTRMKKHMKKDHRCLGDPAETALAELSKTLKDVANKHKVPASYAMPQEANYSLEKTVMQAFIIEELDSSQNGSNGDLLSPTSRRFAPALVYLPVKTRVNGALTTSFTLNPA